MWFRWKPKDPSRHADEGELMHSTACIGKSAVVVKARRSVLDSSCVSSSSSKGCRGPAADATSYMMTHSCLLQEMYNAEQLDILAICFTCVKVLYVGGAVERARRLVALIEPARQAFRTPMHQTVIRNEAAFHGCIQQLLQQQMPPSLPCTPSKDMPIIYLCGDSHCLPGRAPCGSPHAAVQRNLCCR